MTAFPECRIANLSKNDARALNELKCDKSIGNLPVDKGHSTVVMNKSKYKNKAKHLLDDTSAYTVVVDNPLSGVVNRLNAFLLRLKAENKITHREQQLMRGKDKPMARFFRLPKIHRTDVPLRPIVAFTNTPTYDLAKWMSKALMPLTETSPTTIKDAGGL